MQKRSPKLVIKNPQKFNYKKAELLDFIKKYNPFFLLEKNTNRKFKINKFILQHKDLKKEARFENNIVYVDFNNNVDYIWLCLCHELAHIILRTPLWYEPKQIQKILSTKRGVYSKYKYSFCYATEQTMAILLQATCENVAGIRKLQWECWENTFECMGVGKFGREMWKSWQKYVYSKRKNIDKWILRMLNVKFK